MTPAPHLGHASLLGHFDLAEGTSLAQLQEAYHIHAKGMYTDKAGDGAASDLKQIQEGYEEAQRMLRIHGEAGLAQGTSSDGGRGESRYDDQRQSRSTEGRGAHFDPGYASYKDGGFNAYTEGDVRFDPADCASKAEEVVDKDTNSFRSILMEMGVHTMHDSIKDLHKVLGALKTRFQRSMASRKESRMHLRANKT